MSRASQGVTLVEMMVALAVVGVVAAGVVAFFAHYRAVSRQQESLVTLQNNLRAASDHVGSHLRRAAYGVPQSSLPAWVDWVPGFEANPLVVPGAAAGDPASLSVAACTARPVARVAQTLPAGTSSNTVVLESAVAGRPLADVIDPASGRGLIRFAAGASPLGGFAKVVSAPGPGTTAAVVIDTDPGAPGNQGFAARSYFPGTPVCRVDVVTYAVNRAARTLTIDEHHGGGPQAAFDDITDLQVSAAGATYVIRLSGQAEAAPGLAREIRSDVSLRNP